jgi:hypothetical protein
MSHDTLEGHSKRVWRPDDTDELSIPSGTKQGDIYRPEVLETVEAKIDALSEDLRKLSLDISGVLP